MNGSRSRLLIAIAAVVAVLALFYFLFVRGRQAELSDVRDRLESAETATRELQGRLNQLLALEEQEAQLQTRLAEIRELVPVDDEVAGFIFQVQDAATRSGVDFVQITPELPKPPPEGAEVAEVRLTVGAEGGYFSLQDFIRRVTELDRAVRVDGLSMTSEQQPGSNSVSITLAMQVRIFFELPASGATTEAAPAPAPEESPAEESTG